MDARGTLAHLDYISNVNTQTLALSASSPLDGMVVGRARSFGAHLAHFIAAMTERRRMIARIATLQFAAFFPKATFRQ